LGDGEREPTWTKNCCERPRVGQIIRDYQFTVDDPQTFTRQWTVSMPMTGGSRLFEYACHEGNYAMPNMLAGARAEEQARPR